MFRDHGVSPAGLSALLAIWSVTAFALEVPSGAWADLVDRRMLLVLSSPIYAAGFATWIVWPTFTGFALGFVLWGLAGALMSGTFEALLYDELAARGDEDRYAGLYGWSNSAAMVATLVATATATPLFALGGYGAVGWVSVAVALGNGVLAWSLPAAPRIETADESKAADGDRGLLARYAAMLRDGVRESTHHVPVRRLVIIVGVLSGFTAFDEYFAVVAREAGATTSQVPLLVAITVGGQVAGTALAGRTADLSRRAMTAVVTAAGALIAGGALSGHPAGFVAIGVGYGLIENAAVVSNAKLQDTIEGRARATVTSVTGVSEEAVAVAIFAAIGAGSAWWSFSLLLAVCCTPLLAVAAAVHAWWPGRRSSRATSGSGQPGG